MNRKMLLRALIEQERRAASLFVILLLSVICMIDLAIIIYADHGPGLILLLPYTFLYLLIPLAIVLYKKQNPRYIKYMFFLTYTIVCFIIEIAVFFGSSDYSGGNMAEVFFILFTPIFINRRYYLIVTVGIFIKYLLIGFLLQTMQVLLPMAFMLVLTIVAFIILNRFIGYIDAMNKTYLKQFESVVKGIVSALELKDPYTRGHSERVSEYSIILAESLHIYGKDDLKLISYACLLHDVGKVHIPDIILTKPFKLTEEEYEIVKKHPIVGANAIKNIEGMELCLDIVLYHHERWDGKGYPEGLKEMQIPLTARIAAIADSFDAMTSHRSYRGALTAEQARDQIVQGKGTQFDPALVDIFLEVYTSWTHILNNNIDIIEGDVPLSVTK
jgi:HD-GYP domain-containing protein (c-di-GMP phosphodiesterase class II)